jgi:hypothetical protein
MSVWNGAAKGKEKDGDDFLGQAVIPLAEFSLGSDGSAAPMGETGCGAATGPEHHTQREKQRANDDRMREEERGSECKRWTQTDP